MEKNEYEVAVRVTALVKVRTMASSEEEAYDNVKTDFCNDPSSFLEEYDYSIEEDSYDESSAELLDEPW